MDARPQQRPRSKSGFSFKSEKSDKSHGSGRPKVKDLHETSAEKHKRHLSDTSKANPNAAMNEAQPSICSPAPAIAGMSADIIPQLPPRSKPLLSDRCVPSSTRTSTARRSVSSCPPGSR